MQHIRKYERDQKKQIKMWEVTHFTDSYFTGFLFSARMAPPIRSQNAQNIPTILILYVTKLTIRLLSKITSGHDNSSLFQRDILLK